MKSNLFSINSCQKIGSSIGKNEQEFMTLLEMPDTFIIYRFFFEWLNTKNHELSMNRWVDTINSLNYNEKQILYSIIHAEGFSSWDGIKTDYNKINEALSFYRNLRGEISNSKGSLFKLKLEFDNLNKDNLEYIKESSIVIDI